MVLHGRCGHWGADEGTLTKLIKINLIYLKLVVNGIMGAHMAALAEGMALAEKCDLDPLTLLEVFFKLN